MLTHTVVSDGEVFLINNIECEDNRKTSEYCAEKFIQAIDELRNEYKFNVTSGCTDNAASMVKMREILRERYPQLYFYGCSAHMLNLLCQDITLKLLIAKINEVSLIFNAIDFQ